MRIYTATWIIALATVAAASPASSDSLICHGEICYPRIFEPTNDWQVVHEDQEIPRGLHVRLNITTGLKEARLMQDDGHSDIALVPGETVHDVVKPHRPNRPTGDSALFQEALSSLSTQSTCSPEATDALETLEELAHELEYGLRLTLHLDLLFQYMSSESPRCRSAAALVFGSALRNNQNAIDAIGSVTGKLIGLLEDENAESVQRMLIYALSASMAHPRAHAEYTHTTLMRIYTTGSDDLRGKIASFIEDHFAQLLTVQRVTMQKEVYGGHLIEQDDLEQWCVKFQDSVPGTSPIVKEKLLSSIHVIKQNNPDLCHASKPFLKFLADESVGRGAKVQARSLRTLFGNAKASRKYGAIDL